MNPVGQKMPETFHPIPLMNVGCSSHSNLAFQVSFHSTIQTHHVFALANTFIVPWCLNFTLSYVFLRVYKNVKTKTLNKSSSMFIHLYRVLFLVSSIS